MSNCNKIFYILQGDGTTSISCYIVLKCKKKCLSSSTVVNGVLQAKTKRSRFCTDDLDPTVLGGDLSTRVKKHCKIFVNEALSK